MPDFATLTLDRDVACSPAHLFHVMTDRDLRQTWSVPDDDSTLIIDHFDCRAGGREEIRCGPSDAPVFNTIGHFHVVEPEFLSFTETLFVEGQMISVALCGHEIAETQTGSHLRVTLQITSLSGPDVFGEYRSGWGAALDNLSALAAK